MSEARRLLERIDAARRECGDHCNYQAKIGSACEHMDEVLAVIADIPDFLAQPEPAAREAAYVGALQECQRLAIERIQNADSAVKKDIYAADALMGIATIARRALADTSPAAAALLAQGEKAEVYRIALRNLVGFCKAAQMEFHDLDVADAALAPGEET